MTSPKSTAGPCYYNLSVESGADFRQLEFEIEVSFAGTTFGSLPSFEEFVEQTVSRGGKWYRSRRQTVAGADFRSSSSFSLGRRSHSSLDRGFGVEKRLIRWQESVPRHSTQQFREQPQSSRHQRDRSAGGGADFGSNIATDAEEAGEGGPRISAAEENEQERGEGIEKEIPEDPYPSSSYPSISAEHRENKDRLNFLPEFDMPRSVDERKICTIFTVVDSELLLGLTSSTSKSDSQPPNFSNLSASQKMQPSPLLPYFLRAKRVEPIGGTDRLGNDSVVSSNLSAEQRRRNRSVRNFEERMRIMANFGHSTRTMAYNPEDEHLLFEITAINGRILKFDPDLDRAVLLRTRQGQFWARLTIKEKSVEKKFDDFSSERSQQQAKEEEDEEEEVGSGKGACTFEVPENDDYWISYQITINEGLNFPHDGLFVEYRLELPENVHPLARGWENLTGRTQKCFSKSEGRDDVVRFSHPVEVALSYSPTGKCHRGESESQEASRPSGVCWPRLLLRVLAQDAWGRVYVDGYASLSLPVSPGHHPRQEVDCWRPIEPTHAGMLRERHLGQAVDLSSFELAGVRDSGGVDPKIFSKVGLCVESSGTLRLDIQCIHQCRQYIAKDVLRSLSYSTQHSKINAGLNWRIAKVLEEFEQARRQLLKLRAKKLAKFGRFGGGQQKNKSSS